MSRGPSPGPPSGSWPLKPHRGVQGRLHCTAFEVGAVERVAEAGRRCAGWCWIAPQAWAGRATCTSSHIRPLGTKLLQTCQSRWCVWDAPVPSEPRKAALKASAKPGRCFLLLWNCEE